MRALLLLGGLTATALVSVYLSSDLVDLPFNLWKPESPSAKLDRHLAGLDKSTKEIAARHIESVRAFFAERKKRAGAFADSAFSLGGKWEFIKGKVLADDGVGFRQFLLDNFEQQVFKGDDLRVALESAMSGYLTDVQGAENAMLVQLRADLADDDLFRGAMPELQSDEAFQREYKRLIEQVMPTIAGDLKVTLAREAGVLIGTEIAAQMLGQALASRLALSGGIFGTSWSTSLVTFGVGLVAGLVIDYLLDWILRLAGYDPAGEVARQVELALGRMEFQLIEGNAEAIARLRQLRELERTDPSPDAQAQYRAEAEQITKSGALGLRHQLEGLGEVQSRMRRESLQRLLAVKDGRQGVLPQP